MRVCIRNLSIRSDFIRVQHQSTNCLAPMAHGISLGESYTQTRSRNFQVRRRSATERTQAYAPRSQDAACSSARPARYSSAFTSAHSAFTHRAPLWSHQSQEKRIPQTRTTVLEKRSSHHPGKGTAAPDRLPATRPQIRRKKKELQACSVTDDRPPGFATRSRRDAENTLGGSFDLRSRSSRCRYAERAGDSTQSESRSPSCRG